MRSRVCFCNLFEGTQESLPFLSRILGLHNESETVEFVLVPGPFAFRDHLAQACGQIRYDPDVPALNTATRRPLRPVFLAADINPEEALNELIVDGICPFSHHAAPGPSPQRSSEFP